MWRSAAVFPSQQDAETVCRATAQPWDSSKPLKVLVFNVQYMAGKNYVFYYDIEGGPDSRPSLQDVRITIDRIGQMIAERQPDLVLLQEMNDAEDSRSHYIDQLAALQSTLGAASYPCVARAHYWKVGWVPHPKILGPVSMELITLSRYRLRSSTRYQLPLMDNDPLTKRFYFRRALLESRLEMEDGRQIAILNTHLDAWAQGTGLMQRQVERVKGVLEQLERDAVPWLLGGDFNLLPPDGGLQWSRLREEYDRATPLRDLYESYGAVPPLPDLGGAHPQQWYTYFPNDPQARGPDRTIDYLFYSGQWRPLETAVLQQRLDLSDHLPVTAILRLANTEN